MDEETECVYTKILDASAANGVRYECACWKLNLLEKERHSTSCSKCANYDDNVGRRCTYSTESTPNCPITEVNLKPLFDKVLAESPSQKFSELYEHFSKLTVTDNYCGGESFIHCKTYRIITVFNHSNFCCCNTGKNEAAAELASSMVHRGISVRIAGLCYEFWIDLNQIEVDVEDIIQNAKRDYDLEPLISFGDTLRKFKELLQQNLRNSLTNEDVQSVMLIAETHPLFNIPSLINWLSFKMSEMEDTKFFAKLEKNGTAANELARFFGKKYILILYVPLCYQVTNQILSMMTGSLVMDMFKKPRNLIKGRKKQEEIPWFLVHQHKWDHVLDDINKMRDQKEKNKNLKENQVLFLIKFCENDDEEFDCHFSLYEGDKLLTDKLDRFPCPPTAVRIRSPGAGRKTSSMTICVEWDYEELGYPFEFLVEYRQKSSSDDEQWIDWIQKKTTTPRIYLASGPAMEVRVAMDTCIGPSDFSPVLFVPKVENQRPPTVKSITKTTAELKTPKSLKDDKVRQKRSYGTVNRRLI